MERYNDALAMPPYKSGERFEDTYDVILILDDRENFGSVYQSQKKRKVLLNG